MKILFWILKIGSLLILAVLPAIMLYGFLSPWQIASSILANYAPETPILVGVSMSGSYNFSSGKTHDDRVKEQHYILFPSVLKDHQIIRIAQTSEGSIVIMRDKYRLFYLLGGYLFFMIVTWFLWIKPRIKVAKKVRN